MQANKMLQKEIDGMKEKEKENISLNTPTVQVKIGKLV